MRVNRVILIGFRASGKTSVGKELAKKLKFRFIDLDEEIEKSLNKSIRELVE
jgi:shikimate kinase